MAGQRSYTPSRVGSIPTGATSCCGGTSVQTGLISLSWPERYRPPLPVSRGYGSVVERRASNPARRVRFSLPAPVCRRSSSRESRALVTRRLPVRFRPAAPRMPRSSNGRTPVSKTGNGGSNPSRGAIFRSQDRWHSGRCAGLLTRGGRFDSCAVHQITERCRSGQTAFVGNEMGPSRATQVRILLAPPVLRRWSNRRGTRLLSGTMPVRVRPGAPVLRGHGSVRWSATLPTSRTRVRIPLPAPNPFAPSA